VLGAVAARRPRACGRSRRLRPPGPVRQLAQRPRHELGAAAL